VVAAVAARAPQPSATATAVAAYDGSHHAVLQVAGCLGFAASEPLAIWAATACQRLRALGVTAPGAVIALAGGLLAAASTALSGLVTWTSAQPAAASDPAIARVLADLSFAAGAAGFVVPLAWTGLAIAAAGALSAFALLTPAPDFTFPVGRFGGLLWLIAASIALPRTRQVAKTRAQAAPAAAGAS